MLNYSRITPVGISDKPLSPSSKIDINSLLKELKAAGHPVELGERLKGGVVSEVFAATCNGERVVVKFTNDVVDPDPTNYFMPKETQYVDVKLLSYLRKQNVVRVPDLLYASSDFPVSVMEDLRQSGYNLLSAELEKGEIPLNAARNFGSDIALMQLALAKHDEFYTALSGQQIYYSRGQELRQAYPNKPEYFQVNYDRFTTSNQQLSAVDTHPKNAFIGKDGSVAWIDFGCSVWSDSDFALPNFLSHIAIYMLAGYISGDDAIRFIRNAIEGYAEHKSINEKSFTQYFAGEVLHRWAGKWFSGVDATDQKLRILHYGMTVFDKRLFSIDQLLQELAAHSERKLRRKA